MKRTQQVGVGVIAASIIAIALSGCGQERSAEAFCQTMEEHKQAYLSQMEGAGASLEGIVSAAGAIGDLKIMWQDLAKVAPEEIRSDVESVSEAWQEQEDNATDGNWSGVLATALLNGGSMVRVDTYVRETCDINSAASSANETTTGEPEETVTEDVDTEIVEEEPEPEPPAVSMLTDQWTDDIGYSYSLEVDEPTISVSKDIANAAPGTANVTVNYEVTATISNTTSERNAPVPRDLKLEPLWDSTSVPCTLLANAYYRGFASNTEGMSERWCSAGSPLSLSSQYPEISVDSTDVLIGTKQVTVAVPEDQAEAFMDAMQQPAIWALGRKGGENQDLYYGCLMESGSYYLSVATGDTGCPVQDPPTKFYGQD